MADIPDDPPRVAYRIPEVAARTGITADTLYRHAKARRIPTLAVGKVLCVPAWALASWAATGQWDHPAWRPVPPSAEATA